MDSLHCESMNNVNFTAVILIHFLHLNSLSPSFSFSFSFSFSPSLSTHLSQNICISQFNSKNEKTKMTEMTQTTAAFSP